MAETFEDHHTLDHSAGEYARDEVTINGIEGFWTFAEERLRKHHGVGAGHFEAYLKEKEFRWNDRCLKQEAFVDKTLELLADQTMAESTCLNRECP